jgi:biotin carboxylase
MIKAIQRKGYRALVVGTSVEQPGFEIADASLVCEDGDVDEVVKFGLEHMAAGIVPTPVDRTLAWQAEVAKRLSLIFIPAEKIPNFRHKYTQKLALVKAGIPCANGVLLQKGQAWKDEADSIGYPLVCKPIDGYASRGVYKCDNQTELERFVREASGFSSDGSVILEEYLEGREFNAEGVCYQGKPYVCAIVEKISDPFPYTVEMGHIIPAAITPEEKSELTDLADQAAIALDLENGAFNIELKLVDGKARIVEVNGRLAGDFIISHLLKPCTGIDMEEAVVDIALGRKPKLGLPGLQKHGMIRFFNLPAGKRIIEVPDLSRTMQKQGLIWAKSFYGKEDVIPEVTHMGQRSGFVIVVAVSRDKMFEITAEALAEIVSGFELA